MCASQHQIHCAIFLLAVALVYWRTALASIKQVPRMFLRAPLLLVVAISVAAFWYVRNIVLWGEIVSYSPYGKYHLTVFFPPLRSVADVWGYLSESFVFSSKYTEFLDFAFGPLGIFFWGGLVAGVAFSGPTRRVALLVLLYTVLLANSTRQIRYLLPVVPLGLCVLFSLARSLSPKALRIVSQRFSGGLVFAAIFFQAGIALAISYNSNVGNAFRERMRFIEKDMTRNEPVYAPINDLVHYPQMILTSHLDTNYSIDAQLLRVDPLSGLADLQKKIKTYNAEYFLLAAPGVQPRILLFNDFDFFDSISDFKLSSFHLHLFAYNPEKLNKLVRYCREQGWDLGTTLIVSERLKTTFPKELVVGEELKIPGLKHRLFRLQAIRSPEGHVRLFAPTGSLKSAGNL